MSQRTSIIIASVTGVVVLVVVAVFLLRPRHAAPVAEAAAPAGPEPAQRIEWERVQGVLVHVAVGGNAVWGLNRKGAVHTWADGKWKTVRGALTSIDVGEDGSVWGANKRGAVYRYVGEVWEKQPRKLTDVGVGKADQVWGVARNAVFRLENGTWQSKRGALVQISVGGDGTACGVNAKQAVYCWEGAAWKKVADGIKYVAVASKDVIWGVDLMGHPAEYKGGRFEPYASEPKIVQLDVSANGALWAVDAKGAIYRKK